MTQTPQNNTNMDDTSSETSEGSSIDHDPTPTFNQFISGTRHGPYDYVTGSEPHATQAGSRTPPSPTKLGPDSLIPPPLKAIINQWCAAQGPGYSLNKLPCTTVQDLKSLNSSYKGTPATWQDSDGRPLMANMYAISGVDLTRGRQKILVVEGLHDMRGPSIVSYVKGPSNSKRVVYKRWIGVGGDTDGYEDGIAAVKVITPQTQLPQAQPPQAQPPQGKRRDPLPEPSTQNDVLVASDLDHGRDRTRKRKARGGADLELDFSNTSANIKPGDIDTGVKVSVDIPRRQAIGIGQKSKRKRSNNAAMNDPPMEPHLTASPKEPVPSATKASSYKRKVSSKRQASQKKTALDITPPMDPTGYEASQRAQLRRSDPGPRHVRKATQNADADVSEEVIAASQGISPSRRSPSLGATNALDVHSMTCEEPHISAPPAPSRRQIGKRNRTIGHRGPLGDSMLGESATSQMVELVTRTAERSTDDAIESTGTSSMQIPEPSQSRQQTDLPTPPLTHGSTETTLENPGGERQRIKAMRKLKLSQVFVKFNAATPLRPSEAPRIRPFSACDTVGKLFNQARTGNVFGNASDVHSGGKLLTVEFRGSARLPDEVYLINEDDEEDFRRMRTALLRKDWWTEVEKRVYGGGLLDVRHMS